MLDADLAALYGVETRALMQVLLRGVSRKQDVKPFLGEMMVVGEYVREALTTHDMHREAICQAISLVGAGFVQG